MNKEFIIEELYDNVKRPIKYKTNRNIYDIETAMELIKKRKITNASVTTDQYGLRHIIFDKK